MVDFTHMVDLHCHYLPAVDDGAASLDEALALVRAAHNNGISRILLTPHIHVGRYANTRSSLQVRYETFRRAVVSAKIPVELALSAEVRCSDEILGLIERDEIPFLLDAGGAKTLLLELPHSRVPVGLDQFIRWLQKRDIRPLIVHPERNKELMANPQRIAALCKAGCLTQVTAAAVIGRFGDRAQRTARWLLENDFVTILATDAHNLEHRPPLLREAAQWVAQQFGDAYAWRLVGATPASLSTGNFRRTPLRAAASAPAGGGKRIEGRTTAAGRAEGLPAERKSVAEITEVRKSMEVSLPAPVNPAAAHAVPREDHTARPEDDFCGQAFSQLRALLRGRASQSGRAGDKAARALASLDNLHAR